MQDLHRDVCKVRRNLSPALFAIIGGDANKAHERVAKSFDFLDEHERRFDDYRQELCHHLVEVDSKKVPF